MEVASRQRDTKAQARSRHSLRCPTPGWALVWRFAAPYSEELQRSVCRKNVQSVLQGINRRGESQVAQEIFTDHCANLKNKR